MDGAHNIHQWICKFVSKRPVNQTRTGEKKYIFYFSLSRHPELKICMHNIRKFRGLFFGFFTILFLGYYSSLEYLTIHIWSMWCFKLIEVWLCWNKLWKRRKENHTVTGLTVLNKCRCMIQYYHNNGSTLSGKINLWQVSLDVWSSEWVLWWNLIKSVIPSFLSVNQLKPGNLKLMT